MRSGDGETASVRPYREGVRGWLVTVLRELKTVMAWLRRRLAGRADTEHTQIIIRIVITAMMFVYIMSVPLGAEAERIIRQSAIIYSFAVTASLALFAHLLLRPQPSPTRRFCGIATDAIGVNGAIYVGGEAARRRCCSSRSCSGRFSAMASATVGSTWRPRRWRARCCSWRW
jgi:hypothetical protein